MQTFRTLREPNACYSREPRNVMAFKVADG